MALNQKKGGNKQLDASLLGSVHISTSNILSYALVTTAAMLAFFFAFQATLIAYYSNLYSTFAGVIFKFPLYSIPIGRICLTLICVTMLIFTIWSLTMFSMTIKNITHVIESGAALEAKIENLDDGVFSSIMKDHVRRSHHNILSTLGFVVCWVISFFWIVVGLLVWA
jgi:hypothetical protein